MESTVPGIASLVLLGISQISSVTVLNFSPVFPPTFLELGRGEERRGVGLLDHSKNAWQGLNLPSTAQTALERVSLEPQGVQAQIIVDTRQVKMLFI